MTFIFIIITKVHMAPNTISLPTRSKTNPGTRSSHWQVLDDPLKLMAVKVFLGELPASISTCKQSFRISNFFEFHPKRTLAPVPDSVLKTLLEISLRNYFGAGKVKPNLYKVLVKEDFCVTFLI